MERKGEREGVERQEKAYYNLIIKFKTVKL